MKKLLSMLQSLLVASYLFHSVSSAQIDTPKRQFDVRSDSIDQYRNKNTTNYKSRRSISSKSPNLLNSDMGIQRPVEAKKTGFGYHLGFNTKIYHTNNPLSIEGGTFKTSAGVWENSLQNNFLLGAYDLGGASFSPVLSLSYTKFTHFGDEIFEVYDFDTLGLSFAGIFQFSNGWSLRPGLGFNADLNPREGLERQYSQVAPSLALGKSFTMDTVRAFVEWSIAYNFTNSAYTAGLDDDLMNRFETALIGGLGVPFGNFEFSPFLRFALVDYSNKNRTDFMTNLGLQLKYSFTEWFYVKVFANMSARNSDENSMDFSRFDTGAGASFNARF